MAELLCHFINNRDSTVDHLGANAVTANQSNFKFHVSSPLLLCQTSGLQRIHQPAIFNDTVDELRERCGLIGLSGGLIYDFAGIELNAHAVPRLDLSGSLRALHDGKTDIDGVAVENTGKGGGNDAFDAAGLDSQRCVLSG